MKHFCRIILFKTFLLSLLTLPVTTSMQAQSFATVRGGMNYSFLGPGFEGRYGDRIGYLAGLGTQIEILPTFYFIPEVNFSRKAFEFYQPFYIDNSLIDTDLIVGLNYIEIPLNFGYGVITEEEGEPDMFIIFFGGLQINRLIGQNNRFRSTADDVTITFDIENIDDIRKTDFGVSLGFGIGYNRLYFDARYYFGFTSLFDFEMIDDFTNTIALSVGYRFRLN